MPASVYPLSHLMIPGPTPLPDAVREVMARPAIGHRSPEFKAILQRVFAGMKQVFQTQHDVFVYTSSATGAIEAAMMNTLNPGDLVLVLSCGVFSGRWGDMAKSLGLQIEVQAVPAGESNSTEALEQRLKQDVNKEIKAVVLVHSETSTGALNPVQEMVSLIREHGALSIVDTVTGLNAAPFDMDGWGVDLAISGSQKGFMIPPGLSFLAVGPRAWQAFEQCKNPGFYFNFKRNKKAQDGDTTAYTPATHLIMALDVALQMMLAEGLEAMNQRHAKLKAMTRAGLKAMNLPLLVEDDTKASPAVTSVLAPAGVSIDAIRKGLKSEFGITVADGQAELKGKIFRVGHLGYMAERDVLMSLACLEQVLLRLGHPLQAGASIAAAHAAAGLPQASVSV
jgi:aspartate aminotransferase-like enzyme